MDIGEILTKAWKIIWKFKVLWIFGILSSCGQSGGNYGGGNSGVRFSGHEFNLSPGMRRFFQNLEVFFDNIQGWQIAALVVGLFFMFIVLSLVFSAISTVGRIGLIQGTIEAEAGVEKLTFLNLFNKGKPFFWRVFGFNLLLSLAIFVLAFLLVIPIVGFTVLTLGIGFFCLIPLICILIPISWLVSVLIEQVNIAIVAEDLTIIDGVKRGWEIFQSNLGIMIVMALILGLGGLILGILLASPIILAMVPILADLIVGTKTSTDFIWGGGITLSLVCVGIYIPVLIVLSGILQAYIKSAWTLTYLRLTNPSKPEIEFVDDNLIENESLDNP